jgi:hypothetical protein
VRYESACQCCGSETTWEEPHLEHLPRNHPKRQYYRRAVCGECAAVYGPPPLFEEWETVSLSTRSCRFCGASSIRWTGTADWANPRVVLQACLERIAATDGTVRFPTELRQRLARVTTVCRECMASKSEKALYAVLKRRAKRATLEEPMWEPAEEPEIDITVADPEAEPVDEIDVEVDEDLNDLGEDLDGI